jgi:hypothetical protein
MIYDMCYHKNVLLVGNSVELMNYKLDTFIDSFDVVVRFGKAIDASNKEKISLGKKIDIWVTGEFRSKMLYDEKYKRIVDNVPILYNRSRVKIHEDLVKVEEVKNSLDMFSDEEIINIHSEMGIKNNILTEGRLSAGTYTIMFMVDKIKDYSSLSLIGFDFFSKYTSNRRGGNSDPFSWHRPIGLTTFEIHEREKEIKITEEYQKNGKLEWIILSDLELEMINDTEYGSF